jgi:acetyltransferase-like isoleucine patch superfamily enzyme
MAGNLIPRLMQSLVRRLKRSDFTLDPAVGGWVLFAVLARQLLALVRGLRIMLFLRRPQLLFLGRGVRFLNLHRIRFGRAVRLGDFVYISALGTGYVTLGDHSSIGAFSRVIVSTTFDRVGREITIGHRVGIGEFASLGGAGGLYIGDDTIAGAYLSTHPENHVFSDPETLIRLQGVTREGIRIGSNCWIGAKVTFLDGARVGDNCVVAAGAVVRGEFPDNAVIGGVPARILKYREKDAAYSGHGV